MKAKEIEKLDKINEEKKLNQETKNEIAKKALNNFLIALDILLLFIILIVTSRNLNREITTIIYKISSTVLLVFTLVLFEVAYKKDNESIAIHSIEMLVLSITTLLTPYIFVDRPTTFSLIVGTYFTAYYILKNLVIYKKEKNKYIRQTSDITQIIKKESQDDLAKKQKEEMKKENIKESKIEDLKITSKKKAGRPKKENKELNKKTSSKSQKTKEKQHSQKANENTENVIEVKPRKVGRPKKSEIKEESKTPKKVGRPKKVTTEPEEKTLKRKPGRPRKVTVEK